MDFADENNDRTDEYCIFTEHQRFLILRHREEDPEEWILLPSSILLPIILVHSFIVRIDWKDPLMMMILIQSVILFCSLLNPLSILLLYFPLSAPSSPSTMIQSVSHSFIWAERFCRYCWPVDDHHHHRHLVDDGSLFSFNERMNAKSCIISPSVASCAFLFGQSLNPVIQKSPSIKPKRGGMMAAVILAQRGFSHIQALLF